MVQVLYFAIPHCILYVVNCDILKGKRKPSVCYDNSADNKRKTKHAQKTLNPEWNQTVIYKNIHLEQVDKLSLPLSRSLSPSLSLPLSLSDIHTHTYTRTLIPCVLHDIRNSLSLDVFLPELGVCSV